MVDINVQDHIDISSIKDPFERAEKVEGNKGKAFHRTFWFNLRSSFKGNVLAIMALVILIIVLIMSLLAPLSPYNPDAIDAVNKLQLPSLKHIFGTDEFGRDYFTRGLYGGRVSLLVGFSSMLVTILIGTTLGTISGYMGGKVDTIIMRFSDIFVALPSFLLMVILNALFQPGLITLIGVLSLFSWAGIARITRAETMSLKERDYILAAKNLGASNISIIFKHIIPNMSSSISVSASLSVANAILTESSLSFLGLGVQLPQSSWGSMLQLAQKYILDKPYMAIFPGVLILLTVLSFNILGDTLRSVFEPKTR